MAIPVEIAIAPQLANRLRLSGPFSVLDEASFGLVLAGAQVMTFGAGDVLFNQDEAAERLFVVIEGLIGLLVAIEDGRKSLIEMIGPWQMIGEAGLFDSGTYPVSARAIAPTKAVALPAAPFLKLARENAPFRLQLLAFLSARLRVLLRQIADLKLMSAPQRLASFLLGLADSRSGHATVKLNCERRIVASMLGMTPESLSRALRQLREIGVVSDARDRIDIADVEAVKAFTRPKQQPNKGWL
ncbi:MAG: Crp/Fnr family transcriptional regulator [Alphaproteobacteria bacterium]|nr:Crp/Fnr family transcriptional regulator [Alphaproteobacteria bacterium]